MSGLVLPILGAFIGAGGFVPGPFNALSFFVQVGFLAAEKYLAPKQHSEGPRLSDLGVQGSDYGAPIPLVYGKARLAGNIIWSTGINEYKEYIGYSYSASLAIQICEGEVHQLLKMWANNKVLYDWNNGDQKGYEFTDEGDYWMSTKSAVTTHNLRFYKGTQSQLPDSLIEMDKGVGNVPAHRGKCYIVIETIPIADYGNTVPTFTFLIQTTTGETVLITSIVEDVSSRVNLSEDDLDLEAIEEAETTGFVVLARAEARQSMDYLGRFAFCDFCEIDGQMRAVTRGAESLLEIPNEDLGMRLSGSDIALTESPRIQDLELPYRVEIVYVDPDRNFTQNLRPAQRSTVDSQEKAEIALPFVMDGATAQKLADTELYRIWQERTSDSFSVGWKYLWLSPGDVVTITSGSTTRNVRITQSQEALWGAISFRAVEQSAISYSQSEGDNTVGLPPPTVADYGTPTVIFTDTVTLRDGDIDTAGFYAGATVGSEFDWTGLTVQHSSITNGGSPKAVRLPFRATLGTIVGSLDPPVDNNPDPGWDDDNTITVDLVYGELSSVSDDEMRSSENACLVGQEVVQFGTAVFEGVVGGKKRFTLSHLLRARKGSDQFMSHSAGDSFMLLDGAVQRITVSTARINVATTYNLSWGSYGTPTTDTKAFTVDGTSLKALAVSRYIVQGLRYSSHPTPADPEARLLKFFARTRYADAEPGYWASGTSVRQSDPLSFRVRLLNGVTVLNSRTVTDSDAEVETTYTGSELNTIYAGDVPEVLSGDITQLGTFGLGWTRPFGA